MTRPPANKWPDARRQVVRQHFFAGLTDQASANLLNVTRNTVAGQRWRMGLLAGFRVLDIAAAAVQFQPTPRPVTPAVRRFTWEEAA